VTSISTIETGIPTGTWALDPTHSTIGFSVLYMGVAPFQGAFRTFEAILDEHGLRGTAKASSIDVDNDQLAEHIASPDFFDSATYPELSFEAGPVGRDGDRVTFEGVLEVKGNRAPITLAGTITEPVADPWGNTKLGISLAGAVDKNAVGLKWNAPLPDGGSMLADEVELDAKLVFVRSAGNES
jgi:polyisoprenoid-binding protein YceI